MRSTCRIEVIRIESLGVYLDIFGSTFLQNILALAQMTLHTRLNIDTTARTQRGWHDNFFVNLIDSASDDWTLRMQPSVVQQLRVSRKGGPCCLSLLLVLS